MFRRPLNTLFFYEKQIVQNEMFMNSVKTRNLTVKKKQPKANQALNEIHTALQFPISV